MGIHAEQESPGEKRFKVQTAPGRIEHLTAKQLPKLFNLLPIFEDFQKIVNDRGIDYAKKFFEQLLTKQLRSLIQEGVNQPLSPEDWYEVIFNEQNQIEIIDPDYPIEPNIVTRSEKFKTHQTLSGVHEVFLKRFQLEYEQILLLVEILSQHPLLSQSTIESLGNITSEVTLEVEHTMQPVVVSQWYTLEMPATDVHPGNKGFFNVYRLVKTLDGKVYVQTQGYLHGLSTYKAVHKLLFKDQKTTVFPQSEEEIMKSITTLKKERNNLPPDKLLIQLGIQAGDWLLPLRVFFARRRQRQQEEPITRTVQAILKVLEQELDPTLDSSAREDRLSHVFEAFAHPLMTRNEVAPEESVRQYENILKKGGNRDAFIQAMAPSIPGILKSFPGWTACGFMSIGGTAGQALTPGQARLAAHGFGGLKKGETCIPRRCGGCGNINIPDNATVCPECLWAPGMQHGYRPRFHQALAKKQQLPLSTSTGNLPSKNNLASTGKTVGAGYFFQTLI